MATAAPHAIPRNRDGNVALRDGGDGGDGLSAPVCHQPATSEIGQPASSNFPSIPPTDGSLASMQAALQALTQAVNLLSGMQRSADPSGQTGPNPKGSRFTETGRQTKKVHVTNPDDDSQFVDVEVVSHLELTDKVTGETWVWSL